MGRGSIDTLQGDSCLGFCGEGVNRYTTQGIAVWGSVGRGSIDTLHRG